jgi:ABC-type nitrate/sulfonate/bicarbonate transport system substrate-binding protein
LLDICPYRGLLPFTYADAKVFFGRDDLIEEMIGQLRRNPRFLAIVGSSGSGKSSAVQAGLIPRLRSIPGFENATVVTVRPGSSPYREFRKAMVAAGATVEAVAIYD